MENQLLVVEYFVILIIQLFLLLVLFQIHGNRDKVSWVKQSTSILLKIKLPLGCNCDLKLPLFDRNFNEVKESNVTLEKSLNSRIKSVIQDNNRLIINIEGGNYDFEFKHN